MTSLLLILVCILLFSAAIYYRGICIRQNRMINSCEKKLAKETHKARHLSSIINSAREYLKEDSL